MTKPSIVKVTDSSSDSEYFICELAEKLFKMTMYMWEELDKRNMPASDAAQVIYNGIVNYTCQAIHVLKEGVPEDDQQKFLDRFPKNIKDALDMYEEVHKDCDHATCPHS